MNLVHPGAWGSLSGGRPIPNEAKIALDVLPEAFVDDGCSSFPDALGVVVHKITFGRIRPWVITWVCRLHDSDVCTRMHPAGSMTDARLSQVNVQLRDFLVAYLPWRWRWLGWLMRLGLRIARGSGYWDSCGPEVGDWCRHGLRRPYWMS